MGSGTKIELYAEYPQPGEEAVARRLAEYLKWVILQKEYLTGSTFRDVHGKGVTAVKAELIVDADVPPEFRHGVFREPGRRFPAWLRFSNSAQRPAPDKAKDIRGVGVKLMGVEGDKLLESERHATTQDFLFLSSESFFTRDTQEFFDLIRAANSGVLAILGFTVTHLRVAQSLLRWRRRFANLLEAQFFSPPQRLGELAVKYSLRPQSTRRSALPDQPSNNFLREVMHRQLGGSEAAFDFLVQVQKDPYQQSIEDGLAIWSQARSPFRKVATLRLPRQAVDTPERTQVAENLSMNPWHSLEAHRPLGNLNRSRGLIYEEISRFRHERNLEPVVEPTAGPDFLAEA